MVIWIMKRSLVRLCMLLVVFAAIAPRALAYLDPGTGSMIIQILIGFLAGLALFFKNFWLRLFRRKKASHDEIQKE